MADIERQLGGRASAPPSEQTGRPETSSAFCRRARANRRGPEKALGGVPREAEGSELRSHWNLEVALRRNSSLTSRAR